jgi:hypothetical protein
MDADLKQYLEAMEGRLNKHVNAKIEGLENGLIEKMRDMQTELLRGFAAFSEGQTIRLLQGGSGSIEP